MCYEIEWKSPNGVIKRHFGQVTGSEIMAAVTTTEGDPRFDSLRYVINDLSDCTGLKVSPKEIAEIAAIDKAAAHSNPKIRIAFVATLQDVVDAANAYANDPFNTYATRVFSSTGEAKSWLGLLPA